MLYLVAIVPKPGVEVSVIQNALNPAHSWFRITMTSWVICTHEEAAAWTERLRPLAAPEGVLFVARLDPGDRQGWMSQKFWTWFRQHAAHEPH